MVFLQKIRPEPMDAALAFIATMSAPMLSYEESYRIHGCPRGRLVHPALHIAECKPY